MHRQTIGGPPRQREVPEPQKGMLDVICGANAVEMPLAGQSIRDIRATAKDALNIPPDATARLNGRRAEDTVVAKLHDQVEFTAQAAAKG